MPAATDTTKVSASMPSSLTTGSISQGFTARITMSAPLAAARLSRVTCRAGNAAFSLSSLPCEGFDTVMLVAGTILPFAMPRAMALPMFPAPMMAAFMSMVLF